MRSPGGGGGLLMGVELVAHNQTGTLILTKWDDLLSAEGHCTPHVPPDRTLLGSMFKAFSEDTLGYTAVMDNRWWCNAIDECPPVVYHREVLRRRAQTGVVEVKQQQERSYGGMDLERSQ